LISPIIAVMLILSLIRIGETQVPAGPPFQSVNTSNAGLYNVTVIILIMVVATYIIYRLIKRGSIKAFETLKNVLLAIVIISSTLFYVSTYVYGYEIKPLIEYPLSPLILTIVISALILYAAIKARNTVVRAFAISAYSSMAGVIFTIALPAWTLAILLVALPLYDIVMVYKGLLGKLVTELSKYGEGKYPILRGLILDMDGIGIGVGDLVLYATLVSLTMLEYENYGFTFIEGLMASLVSLLGILIGLYVTFRYILPIKKYAPALPIPILLGSIPLLYLITITI
jgi:presenilin-like A22 family membrane protease